MSGALALTRGYFNRPELTAERFIPHPFSHEPGARLYKTGDLVRYRPDGNIEYLGRLDQQVKLRGIRHRAGGDRSGAQATSRRAGERWSSPVRMSQGICASLPTSSLLKSRPTIRELRRFLEKRLPAAMIPATFVMLESLPQTPSGKVDRLALPDPGMLRPALEDLYVAPRTPIEQQVASHLVLTSWA